MSSTQGEFKETEIGTIPAGWEAERLGAIADLSLGRTPRRKEVDKYWSKGVVPWVSISDLNDGIVRQTAEKVSERAFEEVFKGRIVPEGALLLSFKLTIGRVGILGMDAVHNEAIVSLFLDDSRVDRDFLFFLLQQVNYDDFLDSYVKGKTLSKRKLTVFPILLPPLPEQRRIAHVLSTIREAIAAQEDVIAAARETKRSLMHRLFTYGADAEPAAMKETEIGEIPVHWGVVALKDVADLLSGGTPSKKRPDWWEGPIPWASPKDLKQPRLTDTQDHVSLRGVEHGSRLVPPGTVFVVVRGMILAREIPVALAEVEMAFNQDIKALIPNSMVVPDYLLYVLSSHFIGPLVREIGTSAHGTRRIGTSSLERLLVPLPPKWEQRMIADMLCTLEAKIVAEEQGQAALEELFQSMLHQLMTGQLRVDHLELDDDPPE